MGDRRNDVIHGRRRVGRDGRDAIIGRASAKDAELTIDKVGFDELIELRRDLDDARRAVDVLIRDIVRGASGG